MGQKVHPKGYRVGIIRDWESKWYANKKEFSELLVEDYNIRKFLKKKLYSARIADIVLERSKDKVNIILTSAKPGMIIGKSGSSLEDLKAEIAKMTGKEVNISVIDIKRPDLKSQVVAENIALQLEKRISFRKAMKQAMQKAVRAGAKGIKVSVSGRLAGADMARTEFYKEGTVPLQTIRADIDYGFAEADTTYGKLGVKVWIYRGDVFEGRIGIDKEEKDSNSKRKPRKNNRKSTPKKEVEEKEEANGDNSKEN